MERYFIPKDGIGIRTCGSLSKMNHDIKETNIPGFNSLLNGGFKIPSGRSVNVLLKGGPGTGKTTFSLEICAKFAKQGDIGIYYGLEQPLTDLEDMVRRFNWNDNHSFVLAVGGEDIRTKLEEIEKKGALLISSAPKERISSMTECISKDISDIEEKLERTPQFIAIDSINATGQGLSLRNSFNHLINELSVKKNRVIITVLEEQEGEQHLEEFLVDVVVRLGQRYRTDRKDYSERYIEIVKARNQFHYRGKHPFSIVGVEKKVGQAAAYKNSQGGVYVYPSMAARLAEQLRKSQVVSKEERVQFGIDTLDRLLYTGKGGGVARNSTSLLIGERGTKKLPMALHFLASGIRNTEKCLLISLKDDATAISEVAQGYDKLSPCISEENEHLQIEHIRPSYLTPGRFLDKVSTWIRDSRDRGNEIRRIVFDNFAQIRLRFPLLDAEPMFIPALIDLFKTEGCSSLFIDIVEEPEKSLWEFKSPILDLADYVIATQHLPFLGRDHTVISVRRSREGNHNADPAEVRREGNQIVIDGHAFDAITGVLKKDPKPAESFLKLFYESIPEKKFNDEIKKDFEEKYGETVHVTSFSRVDSSTEFPRIKRYWIEGPSSIVRVTSLDEHWVKYAAQQEMLSAIERDWIATNDFLPSVLRRARIGDKLYAVPDHLNLGLFCCRKDLFNTHFEGKQLPENFTELIDMVEPHVPKLKEQGLWGLAFDMETEETLVCTFLEFLFNTNTDKGKMGRRFLNASPEEKSTPLTFLDKVSTGPILQSLKTMRDLVEKKIMPYPCTLQHCKDSIFSRQWYSNIQAVYHDLWHSVDNKGKMKLDKKYQYARFEAMDFPSISVSKMRSSKSTDHYSCSGTWYLGVLKQSVRPRLGYHLINDLTSAYRNCRRYELGAGLPARNSFYKFYGQENLKNVEGLTYNDIGDAFEKNQGCNRKLFHRENFCGNNAELYRLIRPGIAYTLLEILGGDKTPEKGRDEILALVKNKKK